MYPPPIHNNRNSCVPAPMTHHGLGLQTFHFVDCARALLQDNPWVFFLIFCSSNLEDKIQPSLETGDDRPEEPDEGIWDPRNRPPPSYLSWVCEPTSQLHMRTLSPWRPVFPVTRDVTKSWRKWWRNWQQTLTSFAFLARALNVDSCENQAQRRSLAHLFEDFLWHISPSSNVF